MCQQTTPMPPQLKSNNDNHQQSDIFTNLIPKSPTPQPHPKRRSSTTTTTAASLIKESLSISSIALPLILSALLLYSRSIVSMLFLGRLGDLPLAGGSLALAFANISAYSILSGLASAMDPLCSQAFGAANFPLLGLTLQRSVLLLLSASAPISLLWLAAKPLLLLSGQHPSIAHHAHTFLLFSLPDLLLQSLLHPLRIYLRSQSLTLPLTLSAAAATLLHLPLNYLLVCHLHLGLPGVAAASVITNFNIVSFLLLYIVFSGVHRKTWPGLTSECFRDWKTLLNLAIPSCISVCLEWWWYEIMFLLSGLLISPKATVASMGILIQTTSLIYIFPSSLSFSVSTRVGNEIGARRPDRAKRAAIVGLSFSFLLGLAALFFSITIRNVWARMFTADKEIIAITSTVLPIIGLCELGNCPQTTGCGVLRGTARPKVGANINLGCFYLVGMPVAVVLAFYYRMDFVGLWFGLLAAQVSCMVTMMVVLLRTDWEFEARRAAELTGNYEILEPDNDGVKQEGKGDGLC